MPAGLESVTGNFPAHGCNGNSQRIAVRIINQPLNNAGECMIGQLALARNLPQLRCIISSREVIRSAWPSTMTARIASVAPIALANFKGHIGIVANAARHAPAGH